MFYVLSRFLLPSGKNPAKTGLIFLLCHGLKPVATICRPFWGSQIIMLLRVKCVCRGGFIG